MGIVRNRIQFCLVIVGWTACCFFPESTHAQSKRTVDSTNNGGLATASQEIDVSKASPRVKDYYANQARKYLRSTQTVPELLPQFPGLDGSEFGHWGKYDESTNNEISWNEMDLGGLVSAVITHFDVTTTKAISVQLGGEANLCTLFDPVRLSFTDLWQGRLVRFPENRFGVQDNASPGGVQRINLQGSAWKLPEQVKSRYRGLYRFGERVVFEYRIGDAAIRDHAWESDGQFLRAIDVNGELPESASLLLFRTTDEVVDAKGKPGIRILQVGQNLTLALRDPSGELELRTIPQDKSTEIHLRPATEARVQIALVCGDDQERQAALKQFAETVPPDLETMTTGGPARWATKSVTTKGKLGEANLAFAIDTLTIPYRDQNPFGTPFRPTGVDFFPDGRGVVTTLTGDVWLIENIDATLSQLTWTRIAAGLHQPLGVLVQDGKILVAGRDQITRLHDTNGDGEMDFYECVTNQMQTVEGHNFATCLHQDDYGNLYFCAPVEGVVKFDPAKDSLEILGNGLRHSNGMGANHDGSIVFGTAQEGTWTPATAIFEVGGGSYHGWNGPDDKFGKYGYDLPLCFVPRGVDFSAGELAFLPEDERLGPLSGQIIGLSHGNCSHYFVLREELGGISQGGVVPLPGDFLSGAHRLRFNSADGNLYVAGTAGWKSYAREIGSLQRIRYTGRPLALPTAVETRENGLIIRFNTRLDPDSVTTRNIFCEQWNYMYNPGYGSAEYSTKVLRKSEDGEEIPVEGHDRVPVKSVHLLEDGRSVFVEIPQLHPVTQFHAYSEFAAKTDDAGAQPRRFSSDIYYTIKQLGSPYENIRGYTKVAKAAYPDFPVGKLYPPDPRLLEQEKFAANRPADAIPVEIEAQTGLKFSPNEIRVPPGRHIALTVKNKDVNMHHNLVLLQPGHLQKTGEAATLLANDPSAMGIHYVPEDPGSIWRFTPILHPNEEYTIDFVTPQKPGAYPFVCTFPGHWQAMRGVLYVVSENGPLPALEDQIEQTRKFVKMWMAKDLDFEMKNLHQGSIDRGRRIFSLAGCVKCHTVNGEGSKVGPDLTDVNKKFKEMQLLEQIISPSKEINKDFQVQIVNRSNGKVHTGLVHKWDQGNKALVLLENPLQPAELTAIPYAEISSVAGSKLSTMPEGLLMTFHRDEIRDLVLYVQSGGKGPVKGGP